MELITLLIRIPTIITWIMTATNIFTLFHNKFSVEKFYRIRKLLSIVRWITNLIAVLGIFYFEFYEIAIIMAGLMLYCAIEDIIVLIVLKKIISKNKR